VSLASVQILRKSAMVFPQQVQAKESLGSILALVDTALTYNQHVCCILIDVNIDVEGVQMYAIQAA